MTGGGGRTIIRMFAETHHFILKPVPKGEETRVCGICASSPGGLHEHGVQCFAASSAPNSLPKDIEQYNLYACL